MLPPYLENNPSLHVDFKTRQLSYPGKNDHTHDLLLTVYAEENNFHLVKIPLCWDLSIYPEGQDIFLSNWIAEHLTGWWLYRYHPGDIWLYYFQDIKSALLFKLAQLI